MKRRQFFKALSAGLVAGSACEPSFAQTTQDVKWRLVSSFPRGRDLLFGASEAFAKRLLEITNGRFKIEVSASNEIVAGLQALDAVQEGKVELCHTSSNYYVGKDPAFCFGSGLPFGLNSRQQSAWLLEGGGKVLFNDFCEKYNLKPILCGSTGAKMGGWFKKEIRTTADLKGLKLRIGGLGALILSKLGVVPQALAGADIYNALEAGTIDGADWLSPYDDEKLKLVKVAPFYHYPGWWEGSAQLHLFINLEKWQTLSPSFQAAFYAAAAETGVLLQARYDVENASSLIRLIKAGTQFRPFSQEVLEACWTSAEATYTELSAASPNFKTMYDSLVAFRSDEYLWWQVAEYSYDTFMIRTRAKG
jgi:TRAP-type mannitol/chloroaromatic compound transport system substrate-binding protein